MSDYKPSNDIPLPTDHAELETFAKAWIDTAAQHSINEEYWRNRAEKAEALYNSLTPPMPKLSPQPTGRVIECDKCSGTGKLDEVEWK